MKPFPLILQQMLDNAERQEPSASHQHGLADALREVRQVWEDYETDAKENDKQIDDLNDRIDNLKAEIRGLEKELDDLS